MSFTTKIPESDGEVGVLLFVYGSLKRDYELHWHLKDQHFTGEATTKPLYQLFDCGEYPGLVYCKWDGIVIEGEVYEVSHDILHALDEVEAVDDGLYARQYIELQPPFEDKAIVAYFYLHDTSELKNCGKRWP